MPANRLSNQKEVQKMDRLNKKYSHTAVVIAATLSIVAAANAEPIFDYQAIASAANPAPSGSLAIGRFGDRWLLSLSFPGNRPCECEVASG